MIAWSDILKTIILAPFWRDVKFYLALVNAIAVFSQRFGLTFTPEEIGAINLVIMAAAGISKPTSEFIQQQAYAARVRHMKATDEYNNLTVGKK